jgi:hypothetical protein
VYENGLTGLFQRVQQSCLQHGSDASATSDHADLFLHVRLNLQLLQRALNVKSISGLQFMEVGGHGSVRVLLDQEINIAFLKKGKFSLVSVLGV